MKIYLILLVLGVALSAPFYKKVTHLTDPQAKCLDGSPGFMYLHEGTDTKNLLFYFLGGASCGGNTLADTLSNCYDRSKTFLGSSDLKFWPPLLEWGGILSTDPNKSRFANWTKMVFIYCDGSFHQGNNKVGIKYKDTELFFRGGPITRSHLKYANLHYDFSKSEKIILTGSSAGGMATFVWADYIKSLLPRPEVLYVIPESGIFLDPEFQKTGQVSGALANLMKLSNADENTPLQACSSHYGKTEEWNCLNIQSALPFLNTKMFFVESSYDEYIIKYFMNCNCLSKGKSGYSLINCSPDQIQLIEYYRAYSMNYLNQLASKNHSVWSISCSWHAVFYLDGEYDSLLQRVPANTGLTMRKAVENYVFNNETIKSIDSDAWPKNSPCAY